MTVQTLMWLFPLAVTLHNLEECLWLPDWSRHTPWWPQVDAAEFRFALVVLTLLAYLTAFWGLSRGPGSVGAYLHAGYMLAMLLNAFVPHLVVTLVTRRPMPGVGDRTSARRPGGRRRPVSDAAAGIPCLGRLSPECAAGGGRAARLVAAAFRVGAVGTRTARRSPMMFSGRFMRF